MVCGVPLMAEMEPGNAGCTIVSVKFADADCVGTLESVTLNDSGTAAAGAKGVPSIRPVTGFRERPAGNVPAETLQLYGGTPPIAVSACE